MQKIVEILKQKRFDTRWVSLAQKGICKPHLVFQFSNNAFYNDPALTQHFNPNMLLLDNDTHKHTFLVELELVKAFYGEDIALYKTVNTPKEVIDKNTCRGIELSVS